MQEAKAPTRNSNAATEALLSPCIEKTLPPENGTKSNEMLAGSRYEKRLAMRFTYPAELTPNELGGYSVQFLDFENGYTDGDDIDDAVEMASEVLYLLVEDYFQEDKELPRPTLKWPSDKMVAFVSIELDVSGYAVPAKTAAEMLGVSTSRISQMISRGQLSATKRGRDNYVFIRSIKKRLAEPRKAGRPKQLEMA